VGEGSADRVGRTLVDEVWEVSEPNVSPVDDAAQIVAATCVVHLPASSAGVDHDVDRRVDFIVVVDPAALASPDDPVAGQEARGCESWPDDPLDEEAASDAAGETLEDLAGELELDGVEVVRPEQSTIAAALGAMAQRRSTILDLGPSDCRYAVDTITEIDPCGHRRTLLLFCSDSQAPSSSYCPQHAALCRQPILSRSVRDMERLRRFQETRGRRLSGVALRADLDGE
jgi:hypothetical protein